MNLPIIDVSSLREKGSDPTIVAKALNQACTQNGFFYVIGHGVSEALQHHLEYWSQDFFARPIAEKMAIEMSKAGKAWRGYFPLGNESTAGKPDLKEGLYFGEELGPDDHRVITKLPMHGANQFPKGMDAFKATVLEYVAALTNLGQVLLEGIALSLQLPRTYFSDRYTKDPLVLFRIFHYPPQDQHQEIQASWGVGEHTDYGLLTILKQDHIGGLQVKSKKGWIDAPFIPNSFVCNIGDMLDRMTGGYYLSTPHRVKNTSRKSRYSFPFFFDPNFAASIKAIDLAHLNLMDKQSSVDRWDGADLHLFSGTYQDYILKKVGNVFPDLLK